jgi:RimJ/RimL family protein N-acetyltransferase
MPGLLASMAQEYPDGGFWTSAGEIVQAHVDIPGPQRWSGPRNDEEATLWLSGQERGWACGDCLTFAVLEASENKVVGHIGLKNRDGGQVGSGGRGEIGYWTAADARGRGVAPTAARAVRDWASVTLAASACPASCWCTTWTTRLRAGWR